MVDYRLFTRGHAFGTVEHFAQPFRAPSRPERRFLLRLEHSLTHLARSCVRAWRSPGPRMRVDSGESARGHDRIAEFIEKETRMDGWISAGVYRPTIDRESTEHGTSLEREVFPTWIPRGLFGFRPQADS